MDQDDVEHETNTYPVEVRHRVGPLVLLLLAATACAPFSDTLVVPADLRRDVRQAGRRCPDIDPTLIAAQIHQESKWNPRAVSSSGARGIAQFMPDTWRVWGRDLDQDGRADPFDATEAIDAQARLMCHLHEQIVASGIEGDPVRLALAAYNAGLDPVLRHRGVPPYPETQAYVREILRKRAAVRFHD